MTRTLALTAAIVLATSAVSADPFADNVVANLSAQGFTGIEVKTGPSQTKAEAVMGDRKIEVIWDRESGRILKQEWERADAEDRRDGVEMRTENRDFVRVSDTGRVRDDDDDDRRNRAARGDDDEDDDRHARTSRDDDDDGRDRGHASRGDDDDDNRGRGRDDDEDDDHDDDDRDDDDDHDDDDHDHDDSDDD